MPSEPAVPPMEPTKNAGDTIVVIDDDPAVLDILTRYLSGEGYQVVTVGRGAEAVAVCRRCARRPSRWTS